MRMTSELGSYKLSLVLKSWLWESSLLMTCTKSKLSPLHQIQRDCLQFAILLSAPNHPDYPWHLHQRSNRPTSNEWAREVLVELLMRLIVLTPNFMVYAPWLLVLEVRPKQSPKRSESISKLSLLTKECFVWVDPVEVKVPGDMQPAKSCKRPRDPISSDSILFSWRTIYYYITMTT